MLLSSSTTDSSGLSVYVLFCPRGFKLKVQNFQLRDILLEVSTVSKVRFVAFAPFCIQW